MKKISLFKKLIKFCFWSGILGLIFVLALIIYYGRSLPNYKKLSEYEPPVTSRLYAADGTLIDEFAREKRSFISIKHIPNHVKDAFLAAEDSNFYNHPGIDVGSIMRAFYQNIFRFKEGKNFIGGSTITQQVVKNILLSKERTISRKIKEAILAIRISKTLSKDRVLELYLNEIYLGYNSYGVISAALNYFDKSLDDLTVAESAFLAALPKAPSSLDPRKNYDKALTRRNWVIKRMRQDGFINNEQYELAISTPIIVRNDSNKDKVTAGSFSETTRKKLIEVFDEETLIKKGLVIHTSLNTNYQKIAHKELKKGLMKYDLRHGYRGPLKRIKKEEIESENEEEEEQKDWTEILSEAERPSELRGTNWDLAYVLEIEKDKAIIGFEDSLKGYIALNTLDWAKKYVNLEDPETGEVKKYLKEVKEVSDVFEVGDIIIVEKKPHDLTNQYYLRQIPEINGAVIVMNPHTGAVLAMVGGYNDSKLEFNRAIQAKRQPGSIIKPFTYLAALENNMPPNTIIIDDEVRMKKEDGTYWIPQNYSEKFYGPTPLRIGLEKSRNVVTVRLAEMVGLSRVADVIKRYGIEEEPISNYAMILGASESTLLDITNAYAMIANGGKKITPTFIDKVQDKKGVTILRKDNRECKNCDVDANIFPGNIEFPELAENHEQIIDERTAYQGISLLTGVVERGTAWRARALKKPVAGKTGTTNDSFDAWFVGFSPDVVVGVWAGFDIPKSLGEHETGSSVTVPIFVNIMKEIQKNQTPRPFRVPQGIKFIKLDRNTGLPPGPTTQEKDIIFEAFKEENLEQNNLQNNKEQLDFNMDSETTIY